MSNSIQKPLNIPQKYLCLCRAINPLLQLSRWVGILPIKPNSNKLNHFNTGCNFIVSKFYLGMSIILQIVLCTYILSTTLVRIYVGAPDITDKLDWYLMTAGYMMMEGDSFVSLLFGVIHSPRIAKILEKISLLERTIGDMSKIARKLQRILIVLFILYSLILSSFFFTAWTRRNNFEDVTFQNILESSTGVLIRGLTTIFTQVQCAVVVMMCLLISYKFQHLADKIKLSLENARFYPPLNENKSDKKLKPGTVKWMTAEYNAVKIIYDKIKKKIVSKLIILFLTSIIHLEYISDQHQEANYCLSEINHCFGFQLLVTFTANLFILIYYLYRFITASDKNFANYSQRVHCGLCLIYIVIKILLYMYVGQTVRKMALEPAREMQRAKLLSLPISYQQQIQSLILQWLSVESNQLSAFSVINIGPWLLPSIVGNAITYFLVAMQFKGDSIIESSNTTYITIY